MNLRRLITLVVAIALLAAVIAKVDDQPRVQGMLSPTSLEASENRGPAGLAPVEMDSTSARAAVLNSEEAGSASAETTETVLGWLLIRDCPSELEGAVLNGSLQLQRGDTREIRSVKSGQFELSATTGDEFVPLSGEVNGQALTVLDWTFDGPSKRMVVVAAIRDGCTLRLYDSESGLPAPGAFAARPRTFGATRVAPISDSDPSFEFTPTTELGEILLPAFGSPTLCWIGGGPFAWRRIEIHAAAQRFDASVSRAGSVAVELDRSFNESGTDLVLTLHNDGEGHPCASIALGAGDDHALFRGLDPGPYELRVCAQQIRLRHPHGKIDSSLFCLQTVPVLVVAGETTEVQTGSEFGQSDPLRRVDGKISFGGIQDLDLVENLTLQIESNLPNRPTTVVRIPGRSLRRIDRDIFWTARGLPPGEYRFNLLPHGYTGHFEIDGSEDALVAHTFEPVAPSTVQVVNAAGPVRDARLYWCPSFAADMIWEAEQHTDLIDAGFRLSSANEEIILQAFGPAGNTTAQRMASPFDAGTVFLEVSKHDAFNFKIELSCAGDPLPLTAELQGHFSVSLNGEAVDATFSPMSTTRSELGGGMGSGVNALDVESPAGRLGELRIDPIRDFEHVLGVPMSSTALDDGVLHVELKSTLGPGRGVVSFR